MSSVGHRPTLLEIIQILDAITDISADIRAQDPNASEFIVRLTISREQLKETVPAWGNGLPKPTWLFEEIKEHLQRWQLQQTREAQWVSKEEQLGASIDSLMTHWAEELKKVSNAKIQTFHHCLQKITLSNTVLRLKELKERREAGGVYSAAEARREKARKTWAEDEYEAPKREEEQRKQRERWGAGPDFSQYNDAFRETYYDFFNKIYEDALYGRGNKFRQPPRTDPGKRHWYEVLGLGPAAQANEIRKAHRQLTKKYHPDRYKEVDGHAKMTEINVARDEGLAGLSP